MPRGDKSSYTSKQKRQAHNIESGYKQRGVSTGEAERRAWATVNKETGGGKKGAAIGAGGAGLYAFNRRAARRHFRGRTRTAGTVLSGTALGAGVGAAAGGKRAAAIGAAAGAGGSYLYTRHRRHRRRY